MKVDLHNHTTASGDALTKPADLVSAAIKKGISALAVTDHDTMSAVPEVRRAATGSLYVIPGEEIMCKEGELIGLFLLEEIPPKKAAVEVIEEIRSQGGIVYAPHPFDPQRRGINDERLLAEVDVIEVFNAKSPQSADDMAMRFAEEHGILKGAGSDSHSPSEVGRAYVEVDGPIRGPEELLLRLKRGKPVLERRTSLIEKLWRNLRLSLNRPSGIDEP